MGGEPDTGRRATAASKGGMAFAVALACGAVPAATGPIAFEADEGILIVRGRDSAGDARFEFLAEGKGRLQCVALDSGGKPLAVETAFAESGFVRFADLDVRTVAKVACRRRDR